MKAHFNSLLNHIGRRWAWTCPTTIRNKNVSATGDGEMPVPYHSLTRHRVPKVSEWESVNHSETGREKERGGDTSFLSFNVNAMVQGFWVFDFLSVFAMDSNLIYLLLFFFIAQLHSPLLGELLQSSRCTLSPPGSNCSSRAVLFKI